MRANIKMTIVSLAAVFFAGTLHAQTATAPGTDQQIQYLPGFDKAALEASLKASGDWLHGVDSGSYGPSWDQGATIFKMTMKRDEWNTYLTKIRKPLGSVVSREVVDQRVSKDPKGLPKGDYMVMIYNTKFSSGKSATELVTLQDEEGSWRVMGYYIKENAN
jgi:hypothetical protein